MGLFIDPEACTESTSVSLHHRAFAIYEPGTDSAAISRGSTRAWATMSQWRDTPTQPWGDFTFYTNDNRLNLPKAKKFLAGLVRFHAVLAAWEAGSEEWEPAEKYEEIKPGERLKIGDVVQNGPKGRLHCIDRVTPARAWAGEYCWKIEVTADNWQHIGATRKFAKDYPLRLITP